MITNTLRTMLLATVWLTLLSNDVLLAQENKSDEALVTARPVAIETWCEYLAPAKMPTCELRMTLSESPRIAIATSTSSSVKPRRRILGRAITDIQAFA